MKFLVVVTPPSIYQDTTEEASVENPGLGQGRQEGWRKEVDKEVDEDEEVDEEEEEEENYKEYDKYKHK